MRILQNFTLSQGAFAIWNSTAKTLDEAAYAASYLKHCGACV